MSTQSSSAPEPARHATSTAASPAVGLVGLIAVIVGGILTVVGFLGGIDAGLNGSGNGAALYTGLFIVGGLLVLAGLVLAIVRLVKGPNRVLSVVTIVLALLPVIAAIVLWIAAILAS
jgi:hypothetical protein